MTIYEKIPCFLCGEPVSIKYSKTAKPYFICDPCGVQAFIRREKGISKLKGILNSDWIRENKGAITKPNQVLEIISEIQALSAKLDELENNENIFTALISPDKSLNIQKKAILTNIQKLENTLEKLTKNK